MKMMIGKKRAKKRKRKAKSEDVSTTVQPFSPGTCAGDLQKPVLPLKRFVWALQTIRFPYADAEKASRFGLLRM